MYQPMKRSRIFLKYSSFRSGETHRLHEEIDYKKANVTRPITRNAFRRSSPLKFKDGSGIRSIPIQNRKGVQIPDDKTGELVSIIRSVGFFRRVYSVSRCAFYLVSQIIKFIASEDRPRPLSMLVHSDHPNVINV